MQAGDVQGAAGEHRAVPQCRAAHAGGAAHHPQLSYQRRLHRCAHQPADPRCALHHRPHRAAIPGGACGVNEIPLSAAGSCRHPRHSAGPRAVHRHIEKPSGCAGGLLSLSKNYPNTPVSGIIKETGVSLWRTGEKMHGMSQSS